MLILKRVIFPENSRKKGLIMISVRDFSDKILDKIFPCRMLK